MCHEKGLFCISFVEYKGGQSATKSIPLPADLRGLYQKYCTQTTPKLVFPDIPSTGTYDDTCVVSYSDTDDNRHTNMCSYMRFCLDCVSRASLAGYYKTISGDLAVYHVNRHKIFFSGEAYEADLLVIKTWEDLKCNEGPVIHFKIVKDEQVIVNCTYEFNVNHKANL